MRYGRSTGGVSDIGVAVRKERPFGHRKSGKNRRIRIKLWLVLPARESVAQHNQRKNPALSAFSAVSVSEGLPVLTWERATRQLSRYGISSDSARPRRCVRARQPSR